MRISRSEQPFWNWWPGRFFTWKIDSNHGTVRQTLAYCSSLLVLVWVSHALLETRMLEERNQIILDLSVLQRYHLSVPFFCATLLLALWDLLDMEPETGIFGGDEVHAAKSTYFTPDVRPR